MGRARSYRLTSSDELRAWSKPDRDHRGRQALVERLVERAMGVELTDHLQARSSARAGHKRRGAPRAASSR